jgi:multicomponent Na+:H+ antiporter subunit C
MEMLLAIVVGVLYGTGLYMMMRRNIIKWIIGLALLSHAANVLIFMLGGLTRGRPPVISPGEVALQQPYADPLPQALILTAIVIGFGVQAYALILIKRIYQTVGTDDLDKMKATDS